MRDYKCPNCGTWRVAWKSPFILRWIKFKNQQGWMLGSEIECFECNTTFKSIEGNGIFFVVPRKLSWFDKLVGRKQTSIKGAK
jgi:hypothetical protein